MSTYDPRAMVGGLDAELARLDAQAAAMWPAERRLLEAWGAGDAAVIADLGCGSGQLLSRLAGTYPRARLIGVDHDHDLLAAAVGLTRTGAACELVAGDLARLPLRSASVDLAVLRLVVQHLPDVGAVLGEVRRVLRPLGRVIVFDVDAELWGIAEPLDPVLGSLHRRAWSGDGDPRAARRPDRTVGRRLARTLRAAGFDDPVLSVYSYDSDELGIEALAPLLDPMQLMPFVEAGTIGPAELADAVDRFRRWRARPDAFALLVGFAATAVRS